VPPPVFCRPVEAFFEEPCLPLPSTDDLDDVEAPFRLFPWAFDAEEDLVEEDLFLPEDFASLVPFEPPFTFEAVRPFLPGDSAVLDAVLPALEGF
jgi:hypothetical protein